VTDGFRSNELIDRKIMKLSHAFRILADEVVSLVKHAVFLLKTWSDILSALSFFVILE
jgi:hypothetical protein